MRVGGQEKGTAATYGDDDPSWDEMIEFALPGDVLENEDEQVLPLLSCTICPNIANVNAERHQ